MTIKIEDEQLFVVAISPQGATIEATVTRGVNGTTAAAHATKAVSKALYPADLVGIIERSVTRLYHTRRSSHLIERKLGESTFKYATPTVATTSGPSMFSANEMIQFQALSRKGY